MTVLDGFLLHRFFNVRTKYKWVRFQSKSGQISNIEEVDFLNLFLVNDEVNDVEKSKGNNIEIDILNDTKDKAPDPAVIETAAEEHKGFQMDWPGPYFNCNLLKSYKDFRLLKL